MSYFSVPGQNQSQAQGQQQQQRAPGSQHPQPNLPPTAQYSQQAQQQRQQSHPSSGSSQQSTAIQRAHTLPAPVARQPESFTEVKELRTTFSPNIIRTPGHYRHSSRGGGGGIYSPPLTSSANPRPAPATISHAVQRSHSHPHPNVNPSPNSSAALSRQHSAPSPIIPSSSGDPSRERRSTSIAHLSHFAEEPEGMLSPLVGTLPTSSDSSESSESTVTGAPGGSGGLGHGTRNALHPYVPSGNFGYSSPQRTPPRGQRHRSRSRSDSSSGSESDSDTESESDSEARRRRRERERYSRPSPSSYHRHRPHTRSSSRSAGHGYTPQHTQPRTPTHVSPLGGPAPGPYTPSPIYTPSPVYTPPSATRPTYTPPRANPLPAPPTTSHVFATHVSLPPPQQRTPPAGTWRQKLRYGYWNRRGDFVTPDMYVVYAPQDRANPPELANYPAATEGYRDHTGAFLRYEPTRPELAESLPRQGRPPKLPYEKFVTYVYI
ncbi:hypothetical protein BV25DRAFT_189242 [Artomyces pyxidatus]|uniref:Uncharacterized protein n=1 Tax=Artomyces pyxidatus TaxID=48021 RepID=A0ACB8T7E7_9AGAM|nr:hypothetical protein BV25DRAFT_189242 [Artomyces pyxidatus]